MLGSNSLLLLFLFIGQIEKTLLVKTEVKGLQSQGRAVSVFWSSSLDMAEALRRDYQSIPNMGQEAPSVSEKRFFVLEAGRTHGAHLEYVRSLNRIGQTEVSSPEESDYIVIFCPVASRVGTDVGEALENLPVGKPTILVVMHHTFNPNHVVAESRRQVDNPNVRLTVDCLFYEGKLLKCNRNDIAWSEIQKALGVPASQVSEGNIIINCIKVFGVLATVVLVVIIVVFGMSFWN